MGSFRMGRRRKPPMNLDSIRRRPRAYPASPALGVTSRGGGHPAQHPNVVLSIPDRVSNHLALNAASQFTDLPGLVMLPSFGTYGPRVPIRSSPNVSAAVSAAVLILSASR